MPLFLISRESCRNGFITKTSFNPNAGALIRLAQVKGLDGHSRGIAPSKATARTFPALRCRRSQEFRFILRSCHSTHTCQVVASTPMDLIITVKMTAPKSVSSHQSFIPIFRLKFEHSLAISNRIFLSNPTCLEVTFPSVNFSSYTLYFAKQNYFPPRKPSFS